MILKFQAVHQELRIMGDQGGEHGSRLQKLEDHHAKYDLKLDSQDKVMIQAEEARKVLEAGIQRTHTALEQSLLKVEQVFALHHEAIGKVQIVEEHLAAFISSTFTDLRQEFNAVQAQVVAAGPGEIAGKILSERLDGMVTQLAKLQERVDHASSSSSTPASSSKEAQFVTEIAGLKNQVSEMKARGQKEDPALKCQPCGAREPCSTQDCRIESVHCHHVEELLTRVTALEIAVQPLQDPLPGPRRVAAGD